jgi:hypothetical protein
MIQPISDEFRKWYFDDGNQRRDGAWHGTLRVAAWFVSAIMLLLLMTDISYSAERVDFRRDIQPILADRCWSCHGRDKPMAGLKLSDRDAATAPLENGKIAIVPGKPDASELIRRIESPDTDALMPPPETQKPLTDRQRQLLRLWIADGAEYAPHWSFVPPIATAAPKLAR